MRFCWVRGTAICRAPTMISPEDDGRRRIGRTETENPPRQREAILPTIGGPWLGPPKHKPIDPQRNARNKR